MQVKHLVLFTFFFLFGTRSNAQVTLTYDPVSCGVPTTNVTASVSCGSTIFNAGIVADDTYSGLRPIGFSFNFYGVSYNQFVIGANGNISFTDSLAGTYNPWSIVTSLAGSTIRNSICGPWCDMDFPENGGSCTMQLTGTAPSRKLAVTYCRTSMYNIPYCQGEWITSQIILYETSNIVEVHIMHKTICTAWNNGRAICGVINASGSSSTIAPARDWSTNWNATNEAWRFTPLSASNYSVASIPYSSSSCGSEVYWYDSTSGSFLGSGTIINVPTNVPRHLKVAVFSNCKDSSFYYITVPVPSVYPNPKEIVGQDTLCVGSTALYTDSTHGGTWSFSPELSGSPAPPSGMNVTAVMNGFGDITYTLPTGCKTTKGVIVSLSPGPITPNPITVCRGLTDTVYNTVGGGRWSSANNAIATIGSESGIITGISPGTTLITYKIGSCYKTAPVTVNPQPSVIVPADVIICQGNTVTLSNSVSGGSWSSNAPTVASVGSGSGIVSANAAGAAVISYMLPAGCFSTANISVNATPGNISPSPARVCMNSAITLFNADPGGSWSSGNTGIAVVGSSSGVVAPTSPGTTLISYTFTNGCYRTIPLTVDPSPTAITPSNVQLCPGTSQTLNSTPAGGTWSTSDASVAGINAVSGVVTGSFTPGTATITYTMSTGCYSTTTVNVGSLPESILPSPAVVCIGNPLVMSNGTPGGTWVSGNTSVATIGSGSGIVTTVATGTARISYILLAGCYMTTVMTVSPLPQPILPGDIAMCVGNTGTLSNASGIGTWSSANNAIATVGPTSGLVTGGSPGVTTISYILPGGCYKTVQVTVNSAPAVITSSQDAVCQGGLIFLSCATPAGTWSSGNTAVATVGSGSGNVTGVSPGTAIISYILPGVCYITHTITVQALPDPIIPAGLILCQGGTVTFASTPGGGTWSSGNDLVASVIITSGAVTGTGAGSTTISYTLANGCSRTTQVTVTAAAPISPAEAMICTGRSAVFSNLGGGGTWSIGNGSIASISPILDNIEVTGVSMGTTTLTYTFPGGCKRTASITVNTTPADITGDLTICAKDTTRLSNATGGAGTWSSSSPGYASVSATGLVTGKIGGTTTISYTAANGCGVDAVVTVYALPNAGVINGSGTICLGNGVAHLTNIPGTPGYWYTDTSTALTIDSATGVVSGWSAGTVRVTYHTYTDTNGCSDYSTFVVSVLATAPFSINEIVTRSRCYGDDNGSIYLNILNGSGAYTYNWQNGANAPVLTYLPPGSYSVVVTDTKTSCVKDKAFVLTQPDSLDMTAEVGPDICSEGVGFIKIAMAGGTQPYRYRWTNGATGTELTGLRAGNFELKVTDSNGCDKEYVIPVRDSSGRIHIHTALSPNGDGFNDVWLIDLIEDNPHNEVQVLNKWGNVIWEARAYRNDWEGVGMSGDKLPDGTYYYIVRLNNPDPKCAEAMYKGSLLIKR